jgi:chitinase
VPPVDLPATATTQDTLPYHGNFGQFMKLKKMGMKFNFGMSVGGWTFSKYFSDAVACPRSREAFVNGLICILDTYPGLFDRIDM